MTWFSRLITPTSSLNHRTREIRRRRRQMTLEQLEGRVVLSNVIVQYNPLTLALTIQGDQFNNGIRITENSQAAGGAVTVAGIIAPPAITTINSTAVPFTSTGPVKTIAVTYTGGTVNSFDKIIVTGPGETVATTVTNFNITLANQQNLGLSVANVQNTGAFTLVSNGNINGPGLTPARINNATLVEGPATIDFSSFTTLSITQTSPTCVAAVELGGVAVTGAVNVALGDGAGDSILLDTPGTPADNNVFGSTTLSVGNGAGDSISVIGVAGARNKLKDLTITEGTGAGDKVNVQLLTLTNGAGFGVRSTQNDVSGATGDSTVINNVQLSANALPLNPPPGGFTSLAGIAVTQGNANNDTATVSNVTLPGNISIFQGNGVTDSATVTGDTLSGPLTTFGNISITQGNGNNATATVLNSTVIGNITVTQGTGNNDSATVDPTTLGGSLVIIQGLGNNDSAKVISVTAAGSISITQGNGNTDSALVMNSAATAGSITIIQGNGNGDSATVDPTTIGGNLTITQGNGNSDTVTIASVTVAGNVTVAQGGGNTDTVSITGTRAGSFTSSGGFVTSETGGELNVTQGNGGGNTVNLGSVGATNDVFNNVTITQGNNVNIGAQGNQASIDLVHINDTNITSNLTINQGVIGSPAAVGNYQVIIGETSQVTAGGYSTITQLGGGNQVLLGGAGAVGGDFITSFLDIATGAGGGAIVTALNVVILNGSQGPYTVTGGGADNTLVLLGGNVGGFDADPATFTTITFP